ncbi:MULTISPECIES: class I SAM-dependent methyltransferase [Cyanophyceae]|uniref:class I SAM-dependent methyltransferase n=1 Tax=Cyanophyceae TaxID=3028117 RepID=UPI0023307E99|nr:MULTISPECIES: class I SAM-dependent methyltransferase [Cyanophyceae]MDB9340545.1 class I SAM-dependent methyltransferase [Nodularia spumigena CS-589/07]MDB9401538.1 class I SAM-dependent methyltransferase [Microcystis aeruginosa CS-567/02-A1]MDB9497279.1 class I SAM-dependent methyltransferase [Nodularia spumigena CS-336/02]MDB9532865.1 class I SAM-dependent methyltransferase [Nodularia spumigena CS-1038]
MVDIASDLFEKIRQQFDSSPYPRIPLEKSPKTQPDKLYIHSLVNAYYLRNQKVIDSPGKVILDAGCGTGYKSLMLAGANPGSKIVGIDISAESIKLAQQRLEYHGFDHAEFHFLSLEDLPSLDYQFDYINCDELLYLLPDITVGLKAMKAVLKPDGIIRTNLHSSLQRGDFFRAQKLFAMMGLTEGNPGEMEVEIVSETMKALKDNVQLKAKTWKSNFEKEEGEEIILMNYLLQGDKGYTVPEMFSALADSELEFISMVNWRQWQLLDLFQQPDNLPSFLAMSLPDISQEESLHLYELFNPVHRLLDFWCGHPQPPLDILPVTEWTDADWQGATVHLCPQLKTPQFQEQLIACVREVRAFSISEHLSLVSGSINIDSSTASCLIPLLEQPQPMMSLVERWRQFRPLDPVTLQPTELEVDFNIVKQLLTSLESLGYLMLER